MKQHEAVIEAMRQNGGYATLGYLYQHALLIPNVEWKTKTPFKSINRIVQTHKEFFKIRPGLWALKEAEKYLPKELFAGLRPKQDEETELNHTYYQGLLAEIGNLKGRRTFVPAGDQGRVFVGKKLFDVITLHKMPDFTYPQIVHRTKFIDVVWFNERDIPSHAYEVEHSTDIQNSLLKFVELQDFKIDFHIVADKSRKVEFDRKMALQAFRPLKNSVRFYSYQYVAELHAQSTKLHLIEANPDIYLL